MIGGDSSIRPFLLVSPVSHRICTVTLPPAREGGSVIIDGMKLVEFCPILNFASMRLSIRLVWLEVSMKPPQR